MNSNSPNEHRQAIVIGGSMAGLLAARVLADRYQRVTLVERDVLGTSPENRRGVPQGRHTHGLLASGRQALERLFPGISNQLLDAGALSGDIVRDSRWFMEGACHCRFASGLDGLLMSRPFLEGMVRERLRKLPNVKFKDNQEISGLIASADKSRIVGVAMGGNLLSSDLVVDTSGRGSSSPRWLEAMGYPKPREQRVEVGLSYTTRFFRRHPDDLNGDIAAIIPPTPTGKRGGVMIAQEGWRWTVTLISHFSSSAPDELNGFIEFARGLPAPYIYEFLRGAEPVGEPAVLRFPASVRRRYEQLERFPSGYLVMGDAMSSFNPIYGQGMSVAALEALELETALAEEKGDLARRFFARASKVIDIPWSMAVGNDLRMPEATGPRTLGVKLINKYVTKLHKAAHHDPVVTLAFHKVGNLLAPPPSIMHPRVAWRVLWGNLRQRRGPAPLARTLSANATR